MAQRYDFFYKYGIKFHICKKIYFYFSSGTIIFVQKLSVIMNTLRKFPHTFWVANAIELFERWAWYGFFMLFSMDGDTFNRGYGDCLPFYL